MALGVLHTAAEQGRRVPDDLAVVGYDDIELAPFASPPLTTVAQPKREMGREAVRLQTARIADPSRPPQRTLLPVALRVGRSCGSDAAAVLRSGRTAAGGGVFLEALTRRKS